jgi:predicted DNA-binding transcriptional regulator AlpA
MSELIITTKDDLERMLKSIFGQIERSKPSDLNPEKGDRLNQKQAAEYLGITQSTLIRWKKDGRVPCEQLPGSTKVTYFKSQLKKTMQRNPDILQIARK